MTLGVDWLTLPAVYPVLTAVVVLLLAWLMRRALGYGLKVLLRTGLGVGLLAVLHPLGGVLGLTLGVNLWNGLVIGFLGMPGLGLLLLLDWLAKG